MAFLPAAHINGYFILDGQKYELERFSISFGQEIDHKGQPQKETRGGEIYINLPQIADSNLYMWAKKSTLRKSGQIVFQTDMGVSVLRVNFENAYCVTLSREMGASSGTSTGLAISAESLKINDVEHNNRWV